MNKKSLILAPILAALYLTAATPVVAQVADCLNQVQIQQAASTGQILPLPQIYQQNNLRPNQVVGPVKVCNESGQWFYVLQVLRGANAATLKINAQTGQ